MFAFIEHGKVGFLDTHGRIVVPAVWGIPFGVSSSGPQFLLDVDLWGNGLAPVVDPTTGRYGYIAADGRLVIPARFRRAEPFKDGVARVWLTADSVGLLRPDGSFVATPRYPDIGRFSEGRAAVERDSLWGYVNATGTWVIPPRYSRAAPFTNGLALVLDADRSIYRFIDITGAQAVDVRFDAASAFVDGRAVVQVVGGAQGLIDTHGRYLIVPRAGHVGLWSASGTTSWGLAEGLLPIETDGKWGYATADGEVVIQPLFDEVQAFEHGKAPVRIGKQWGYVDRSGRVVIPPRFDFALPFKEGRALVVVAERAGFIDEQGAFVVEPRYDGAALVFRDGLAWVASWELGRSNTRVGFVDRDGRFVRPMTPIAGP